MEHAFGAQHTMGDHTAFTIGIARAKVKIGMMSLIYNVKRQGQLSTHDCRLLTDETIKTGELRP